MTDVFHPAKQILVVEDDKEVRRSLVLLLELENYTVVQAPHGVAALEVMQEGTPDLIISDINMPEMDGLAFFKAVHENPAWVPIPFIFLTANDAPEDVRKGRELGVEDYLTKPVGDRDLMTIINARMLRATEVRLAQTGQAYLDTVTMMANAIEGRDPYTYGHIGRVTLYATMLAKALNWPEEHLYTLKFGGLLHDMGKIVVPDQVLKKPGRLDDEEWKLIKQHPVAGAKIIRGIKHLKATIPYILFHHERWDGSGYPYGLQGKKIPAEGRLLALADVYDALTSERPYRKGMPYQKVLKIIHQDSGSHFDPNLAPVFIKIMAKYQADKNDT